MPHLKKAALGVGLYCPPLKPGLPVYEILVHYCMTWWNTKEEKSR